MVASYMPIILFIASTWMLAAMSIFIVIKAKRWRVRVLGGMFVLLTLAPSGIVLSAVKPEWFDARFKVFKEFYADIKVGMTREEVMDLVDVHYPAGGPRQRPKLSEDPYTEERWGFFMNPEGSQEPNCEGIFFDMKNGKVSKVIYSPD